MLEISEKTCFHVPDYINIISEKEKLLQRLENILKKGLLTSEEQWRDKNALSLTPHNQIDVWAPDDKHFGLRANLVSIIRWFGTTVGLLLEAENYSTQDYPHALVWVWISPEIKWLVVKRSEPWAFDKTFIKALENLSEKYNVLLLDEKLNII